MLRIFQSNRLEPLSYRLVERLKQPSHEVFAQVHICVPSHGVGTWLSQFIAQNLGISALIKTHFLGALPWKLMPLVLPSINHEQLLSTQTMQWMIYTFLQNAPQHTTDTIVQHQLMAAIMPSHGHFTDDHVLQRTHQSELLYRCGVIAKTFNHYMTYRPQLLNAWHHQRSYVETVSTISSTTKLQLLASEQWQCTLWLALFDTFYCQRQQQKKAFWDTLKTNVEAVAKLPKTISIFCPLELTAQDIDFIDQLAHYCDIDIYHVNPCCEYWIDGVHPRWLARFSRKNPLAAALYDSFPLLNQLGKQQANNTYALTQLAGDHPHCQWHDLFIEPAKTNLLKHLQYELLSLDKSTDLWPYPAKDDSIALHVCHSLFRQIEVLRDELAYWLHTHPDANPSDILVLTPQLEQTAPLIELIMSQTSEPNTTHPATGQSQRIPYRVTGLADHHSQLLWQTFHQAYSLLDDTFTCDAFFDWLSLPACLQLFSLTTSDTHQLKTLLMDAGFRRGFNHTHIQAFLSADDLDHRFTLAYALERLMVGYVMPSNQLFRHHTLPYALNIAQMRIVAKLAIVFDYLLLCQSHLALPAQTLPQWLSLIQHSLNTWFNLPELAQGYTSVQLAIKSLQPPTITSNFAAQTIALQMVLEEIRGTIEQLIHSPTPTGAVTFAALGSMRPLPYRLIVLLDLSTSIFPKKHYPPSFDLMHQLDSQRGDPSPYQNDTASLLDAFIQAQDGCWLFYTGFHEHEPIVPSGPIQAIIDYLHERTGKVEWQHHHSANPFDMAALTNSHMRSPWHKLTANQTPTIFTDTLLDGNIPAQIDSREFISELENPARYFLIHAGLSPFKEHSTTSSLEPLFLDPLNRYQLYHHLLDDCSTAAISQLQTTPLLPVGKLGMTQLHDLLSIQNANLQQLADQGIIAKPTITQTHYISIDGLEFSIQLPKDSAQPLWLILSASKAKEKHYLRYWIYHLFWQLHAQTPSENSRMLCVSFQDKPIFFQPVPIDQARQYLQDWIVVWRQNHTRPWVLPPELGFTALKDIAKALTHWQYGSYSTLGNIIDKNWCEHPDWELTLRGKRAADELQSHLEQFADKLYAPIMAHISNKQTTS